MVFILSKDTEETAERGRRFSSVWFVLFVFGVHASEALLIVTVRMVPPADTWPEIAVELWSWREEVLLATKVGDFFIVQKVLDHSLFRAMHA